MKIQIFGFALLICLASASQIANAKGCLKGAAVGGVAGHVVGGHGVAGAAIGCAVGHHQAAKKDKQESAAAAAAPVQKNTPSQ